MPSCIIGMQENELYSQIIINYNNFLLLSRSVDSESIIELKKTYKVIIDLQDKHPSIGQAEYKRLYELYELNLRTLPLGALKIVELWAQGTMNKYVMQGAIDIFSSPPNNIDLGSIVSYVSLFEQKRIIAERLVETLRKKAGL